MIVLYKGARGRGKTLTMTKDAYRFFCKGYKIYANYGLTFGEKVTSDYILSLNRESNLFNCVLVLDELQLFFDSRNFSRQQNKDFSNFLQQSRKRNIHILYTTQYINTCDLRIRQQTDIVAYPKFNNKLQVCGCKYFDITLLEDGTEVYDLKPTLVIYPASRIFPLFDTNEMLK